MPAVDRVGAFEGGQASLRNQIHQGVMCWQPDLLPVWSHTEHVLLGCGAAQKRWNK